MPGGDGDLAWRLHAAAARPLVAVAKLLRRDPLERLHLTLRALRWFPFSTPGAPGYAATVWREPDAVVTHRTHCPPLAFVKSYVETHGDRGELDLFRRSWCGYDWAFARILGEGSGRVGYYERPHTLSHVDVVCDMRWRGATLETENQAMVSRDLIVWRSTPAETRTRQR